MKYVVLVAFVDPQKALGSKDVARKALKKILPDDDIIERTDRYYVYLKPYGADDEAIRKRMKLQGTPPLYLPMPPH